MEVSEIVIAVVVVIVAYFLGTFPSAELVAKRFGRDITKVGSGNPGASNVIRELGWKAKTMTPDLARIMVEADVQALRHEGSHWIDTPKFI